MFYIYFFKFKLFLKIIFSEGLGWKRSIY